MRNRVKWKLALLLLLALGSAWITFSASRILLKSTSPEIVKQNERVLSFSQGALSALPKTLKAVLASEQKKLDTLKNSYRQEVQWLTFGLALLLFVLMIFLERLGRAYEIQFESFESNDDVAHQPKTEREGVFHSVQTSPSSLSTLISDLHSLESIQSGSLSISIQKLKVTELLNRVSKKVLPIIKQNSSLLEIRVLSGGETIDGSSDFWIEADSEKLERALYHLLELAAQNSGKDFLVALLVEKADQELTFMIANDGEGYDQKDLDFLISVSANPEQKSLIAKNQNLGITIAVALVKALGGRFSAESRLGKGSKFTLSFPIKPNATIEDSTGLKTEITVQASVQRQS